MKKLLWIGILSMLLCGCAQGETTSHTDQSNEAQTIQLQYADGDALIDSGYFTEMEEAGFMPLLFGRYEEKYELSGIDTAGQTYVYYFTHKETGTQLEAAITYKTVPDSFENLVETAPVTHGEVVGVNVGGYDYDAYLYKQADRWHISYLITTGYQCTISAATDDSKLLLTYMNELLPYEKPLWLTLFGVEPAPEETLGTNINSEITNYQQYSTVEEFLASDFCREMQENGFITYLLEYDLERYTFSGIGSDAHFYRFSFIDNRTGEGISCTITYDVYEDSVEQFDDNVRIPVEKQFTTTVKDGMVFDVYIYRAPFEDEPEYNLQYLPFDDYKMSIHASASTPEEALAYIHEFDLVPVTEEGMPAETTHALEDEYICGIPYETVHYDTEEEFLASAFCEKMRKEGFTPHLLIYDKDKYELLKMRSDASFYDYQFRNKETGGGVHCTVSYYIQEVGLFDLYANTTLKDRENDVRTTVEKNGKTYDVYVAKSDYSDKDHYTLEYLPLYDFSLYIDADASTADEAISYIHEFDLVPVTEEETDLASETEQPAPESAESSEAAAPADPE